MSGEYNRMKTVFDEGLGIAVGRVYELRNGRFSMSVTCRLGCRSCDWSGLYDDERSATRAAVRRMKAESDHQCEPEATDAK